MQYPVDRRSFLAAGVVALAAPARRREPRVRRVVLRDVGFAVAAVAVQGSAWDGLNALANPGAAGWPDATNTGVPAGSSLTPQSGTVSSTSDGQVIELLDMSAGGHIVVTHANVTVRKCRILSNSSWAIDIMSAAAATVEDCEIDCNEQLGAVQCGANSLVQRCNCYNGENGLRNWNSGGPTNLRNNYIHDFFSPGAPHYDGVELFGGNSGDIVYHNTIVLDQASVSPIDVAPDTSTVGVLLDSNLIDGGGFILNIRNIDGPLSGVAILNNRFGENHGFGYAAIDSGTVSSVSGNVRDLTGVNIDGDL